MSGRDRRPGHVPKSSDISVGYGPDQRGGPVHYRGVAEALAVPESELLLFGKPEARPMRRMGVALASGSSLAEARGRADTAAQAVGLEIGG